MQRQNSSSLFESLVAVVAIAVTVVFSPILRYWYNRWGATPEEVKRRFPDDERVPHPRLSYTRAITINAPFTTVWQWLVQIGQGRGGLYSYEWLENLIGCQIHNADHILPEFQTLAAGDSVRLGRKGYPLYKVVTVKPNHKLVLAGADPKTEEVPAAIDPSSPHYVSGNWVFVVEPQRGDRTRLLVRSRLDYYPGLFNKIIWRVFTEPIGFVMERRMLLGIKQRAESNRRKMTPEIKPV